MSGPCPVAVGYYGSKAGMLDFIHSNIPAGATKLLDLFGGSGAVSLSLIGGRFTQIVYNDINSRMVNFYRTLRNTPQELIDAIDLTPSSREEFERCFDKGNVSPDPIEDARRVFVLLNQSWMRKGLIGSSWQYYGLGGDNRSSARHFRSRKDKLPRVAKALEEIELENSHWSRLVPDANDRTLIFADPPYDLSARSGGQGYEHEFKTDREHEELAQALSASPAAVMVCGYHSPLYERLYDPSIWTIKERAVNRNKKTASDSQADGRRTEVLWIKQASTPQPDEFGLI